MLNRLHLSIIVSELGLDAVIGHESFHLVQIGLIGPGDCGVVVASQRRVSANERCESGVRCCEGDALGTGSHPTVTQGLDDQRQTPLHVAGLIEDIPHYRLPVLRLHPSSRKPPIPTVDKALVISELADIDRDIRLLYSKFSGYFGSCPGDRTSSLKESVSRVFYSQKFRLD